MDKNTEQQGTISAIQKNPVLVLALLFIGWQLVYPQIEVKTKTNWQTQVTQDIASIKIKLENYENTLKRIEEKGEANFTRAEFEAEKTLILQQVDAKIQRSQNEVFSQVNERLDVLIKLIEK